MDRFFGVEAPPSPGVRANPLEEESTCKAYGLVAGVVPTRRPRRRLPAPRSAALAATVSDPVELKGRIFLVIGR